MTDPDHPRYWQQMLGLLTSYRCACCFGKGLKLWRVPHAANGGYMLCVSCLCAKFGAATVATTGDWVDPALLRVTNQVHGWVPAIPSHWDEGLEFWGLTSIPGEGWEWWRRLQLRIPSAEQARP